MIYDRGIVRNIAIDGFLRRITSKHSCRLRGQLAVETELYYSIITNNSISLLAKRYGGHADGTDNYEVVSVGWIFIDMNFRGIRVYDRQFYYQLHQRISLYLINLIR